MHIGARDTMMVAAQLAPLGRRPVHLIRLHKLQLGKRLLFRTYSLQHPRVTQDDLYYEVGPEVRFGRAISCRLWGGQGTQPKIAG